MSSIYNSMFWRGDGSPSSRNDKHNISDTSFTQRSPIDPKQPRLQSGLSFRPDI